MRFGGNTKFRLQVLGCAPALEGIALRSSAWSGAALLALVLSGCGTDEPKVVIPKNPTLPPPNASLSGGPSTDPVAPSPSRQQ